MNKTLILTLMMSFILVISLTVVDAAAYIKFDGIDGESNDDAHKEWIDVLSISQAMHKPGSGTGASRRRGDVIMEDIVLTKELDKSSPKLQEALANGKVIPKVEFELTASFSDSGRVTYYAYELKNVQIVSYSIMADGQSEEVPFEEVIFNFEEIKVTYTEHDDRGGIKGVVEFLWSLVKGKRA